MVVNFIDSVGIYILNKLNSIGEFGFFIIRFLSVFLRKPINKRQLIQQMYIIGIKSFDIIALTGAFAGLALAVQSYIGFTRVQAEQFTGLVATLGIVRELGPVLTGLIVSAKTGSAIAAEIGTMKITEQIDALKTLCIDPFEYLVIPRILATFLMMPFVTLFAMLFGIISSYVLCIYMLSINEQAYINLIQEYLRMNDIIGGLIKALFFGFLLSVVGTYKGYNTDGGAKGVGESTTEAVVTASIFILIGNYILTSFLFNTGISS